MRDAIPHRTKSAAERGGASSRAASFRDGVPKLLRALASQVFVIALLLGAIGRSLSVPQEMQQVSHTHLGRLLFGERADVLGAPVQPTE